MSWSKTYSHTIAYSIDILLASWLWNRSDVTISSLCWREMNGGKPNRGWRALAWLLEHIDPGHLAGARQADIDRALTVLKLLDAAVINAAPKP